MQETVDMLRTLGADVVSTEDALKKDLGMFLWYVL